MAPTPSGYLHLGNILSFVYTISLARKTGAKVLLRIDDMDRERAAPQYIQDIFDTLNFLELPWDEGPANPKAFEADYAQQHRLPLYHAALQQLIDTGQVFACTCSRAEILSSSADGGYPGTCRHKGLSLATPNCALRIKTPGTLAYNINTLGGAKVVPGIPVALRDFVVRKKDGDPAYQLCSVLDDVFYGVDLVVRGADLWPSTIAQYHLSTLLQEQQFRNVTFHHHQLILDKNGKKLSKSAGATSVYQLRKKGMKAADVYGLIARELGVQEPVSDWVSLAGALNELQEACVLPSGRVQVITKGKTQ